MTRQFRRLGVAMLVLYGALFVQLNVVQVLRADEYNDNPANIRAVTRDYGRPRGRIISADDVILAESVAHDGRFGRRRVYPEGALFGHVTGFFSFTYGSDGVEKTYNNELAGRSGSRRVEDLVDMLVDDDVTSDVYLTLHKSVQQVARDALGERPGAVVALDPRDGSVLALWSYPSYDPGPVSDVDPAVADGARFLLTQDAANPLRARAWRETYFPGSTFKVVTAAAGLAAGSFTLDQPVFPNEAQYIPPNTTRPIQNFSRGKPCGGNLVQNLQVSCNTAFARMGVELGADRLIGQAKAFGFDEKPPLDLPGVEPSPIEDVEFFEQNVPLLAQTAIGQNTLRATPLEMALVAAAVANGGEIVKPHVLREVRDDENKVVRRGPREVWRRALDPQYAAMLRDAMVAVTQPPGTATRLAPPGVPTAGKTGTAQIGNGLSHAWIIGFAPADNPRVAIAVIVEGQRGGEDATGGRTAAPIGQAVLAAALAAVPE